MLCNFYYHSVLNTLEIRHLETCVLFLWLHLEITFSFMHLTTGCIGGREKLAHRFRSAGKTRRRRRRRKRGDAENALSKSKVIKLRVFVKA